MNLILSIFINNKFNFNILTHEKIIQLVEKKIIKSSL